jgi:23S rRNA (cytosine1962-C5)-methyltransferase
VGHYQIGTIAVRVLSFRDIPIDDAFWYSRLKAAYDMRVCIGIAENPENNTFRLIHGEGDNLPGLVIDCYGSTAVMQAHSVGIHESRKVIAENLVKVMGGRVQHVFYKSETTLPYKADLGQENGFIIGGSQDNTAMENGLKFHVDWLRGQKTGFFVDQRENRSLLERYAKDKRVLNMFCYTGGFSFYAMRGGAQLVHSVDSSAKAIELTNANVALNFPGDTRHEAFCEDAFKFLDAADDTYDLIILDPPAFAKHRGALHNALKGYTRLNVKAFQRIKKGGILFTFSCSQVVTKDHFRNAVFTAAALSGRKVRILHQLHQPADHPINIYHPEGEYLKGLVLYVE